ncbi:DUF2971 domain-containing protein [Variovorax boronicumulans]|uniref:DUF2971 domain-containing protein n=1 Tax=Variovorax boronicumulans TaxID=436515 RepID=UPI0027846265|nr:DUF2971 domain-containing protein [Variovorax boronicumulans]MDQ0042328.1 hypothetical protein [Variovorax boronicumulans]
MNIQPNRKKFYKYRSMRSDAVRWVEQIVLQNELYFARALDFNDPFDLRPTLSFEASHETRVNDFMRLVRERKPELSPAQTNAMAQELVSAAFSPANFNETTSAMHTQITKMLTEQVGVFCVSSKRDDILMWSHYADSHSGVCLEFDEECPLMMQAQEVIYSELRRPINRYIDDYTAMAEKALQTKSSHWEYEAEWRSLRLDDGPGVVKFLPEHLTGIIIGDRASQSTIDKVNEWTLKRPTPWTVSRASVSKDRFALEIAPA